MKVRFAREAFADLDAIEAYIAQDNPRAAATTVQRIQAAADRLEWYPLSGREGLISGTREVVVPGLPYVLVYAPLDEEVLVISVVHGARQRQTPS